MKKHDKVGIRKPVTMGNIKALVAVLFPVVGFVDIVALTYLFSVFQTGIRAETVLPAFLMLLAPLLIHIFLMKTVFHMAGSLGVVMKKTDRFWLWILSYLVEGLTVPVYLIFFQYWFSL